MATETKQSFQVTATPYICVHDATAALEFYKKAFGAIETMRIGEPGQIGHAEIKIGSATIMLSDEFPDFGAISPKTIGGSATMIVLQVEDVDTFFAQAVAAGATATRPVENQFYGERAGQVTDPFGHRWGLSTVIEELSPEEIEKRAVAHSGQS